MVIDDQGKDRVMVGFLKKALPGLYRLKMKEKTKGQDNYLWVEYGHNANRKQSNFSLSLLYKQGRGAEGGWLRRTRPTVWWRMKESTKAFGLVESCPARKHLYP